MIRLAAVSLLAAITVAGCGGSPAAPPASVARIPCCAPVQTAKDARRWAAQWCDVAVSMPRERVLSMMGTPTHSSEEALTWDGFGYQLNAFFDTHARVMQLDINEAVTTGARRAGLGCGATR